MHSDTLSNDQPFATVENPMNARRLRCGGGSIFARPLRRFCVLVGCLLLPVSAIGQEEEDRPAATEQQEREELDGIWPSQRMMELLITRWGEDVAVQYELDDEQRKQLREGMLDRWPKFFQENRAEIQPVINDFLEMRLELEPPTKEVVKEWTDRALPLFKKFRRELNDGAKEFREVLTPRQRTKFEVEMFKFGAGMNLAEAKLNLWAKGEFEEREVWDPPRAERRRRRQAEMKESDETKEDENPILAELDLWEQYVQEFIRNYELDDGQRTAARSILSELKQRAADYAQRNRREVMQLEARLDDPEKTDEEAAVLKKQIVELYGPVDEMFTELQNRLEQLPTSAQRARSKERSEEPDEQSS